VLYAAPSFEHLVDELGGFFRRFDEASLAA
jgi:hypothetical protein